MYCYGSISEPCYLLRHYCLPPAGNFDFYYERFMYPTILIPGLWRWTQYQLLIVSHMMVVIMSTELASDKIVVS